MRYLFIGVFFLIYNFSFSQYVLHGNVTDKNKNPLSEVHIKVENANLGAVTDADGKFKLIFSDNQFYTILLSAVGYENKEVLVKNIQELNVMLKQELQLIDEVVISASRKPELLINAPTSVSIIHEKEIKQKPIENIAKSLSNLVGVDVAEDNIGQYSITLRGDRYPFGNRTLVLIDNRNIKLPGFEYSDFSRTPLLTEDYEQIEVSRGPASALYGAGVQSGVILLKTKSPITYPGTTMALTTGSQHTFQFGFKHAEKVNNNFGYKISAKYETANAWGYDKNDELDQAHLEINNIIIKNAISNKTILTLNSNNPVNNDVQNLGLAGSLEYRKDGNMLNINLGYSNGRTPYYIDRGDGYLDFPTFYSQIRYSKPNFFLQYDNSFSSTKEGDSYNYKSGEVFIAKNKVHEIESQYNFDLLKNKLNISIGGEYRLETTDSEQTIYGRFEENDDFAIFGGYLFADYALVKDKLNLKAIGRLDHFEAMETTEVSPQFAIVYKPNPKHAFRGTWSKTATAAASVDFYGDVTVTVPTNTHPFYINFLGGNSLYDYDNPITNTFLLTDAADSPFLSFNGTGFPLQIAFQLALQELSGQIPNGLLGFLQTKTPNINGVSNPTFLNPLTEQPYGNGVDPLASKTAKLKPSISENFELGYKGFFCNKLAFEVSSYWGRNIRISQQVTNPLAQYFSISSDLVNGINAAISDAEYAFLASQSGVSPEEIKGLIEQAFTVVGDNLSAQPIGVVAHSFANKYPNSAEIHLTTQSKVVDRPIVWGGVEVGASYFFNKNLSVFANYNFVNNDFDEDKLVNTGLTPRNRAKFGIDFIKDLGFSFGASMRYQDEYTANFQDAYRFKGIMPSYSIYDAYVNHAFKSGLRLSISGQNIFNAKYRAYPFTPKIGNMFLFKMTYMFN